MKNIKFLAIGLLLACSAPTQAAQVREENYVVGADVDASGHIIATQIDAKVPADVANVLAGAVKRWQFKPATRDGHPVPAHTFIRARLQAAPTNDGKYTLSVQFMDNGPKFHKGNVPPRYPRSEARARHQAFAVLEATVQPDGSLTEMTTHSRFKDWPLQPAFGRAVLEAARHWHATPEQVDGQAVATRMRIPVTFTLRGEGFTRERAKILHEAALSERATANTEVDPSDIQLPSDQPVALDSPLQLRTVAAAAVPH